MESRKPLHDRLKYYIREGNVFVRINAELSSRRVGLMSHSNSDNAHHGMTIPAYILLVQSWKASATLSFYVQFPTLA